jgi:hypothetical protein
LISIQLLLWEVLFSIGIHVVRLDGCFDGGRDTTGQTAIRPGSSADPRRRGYCKA